MTALDPRDPYLQTRRRGGFSPERTHHKRACEGGIDLVVLDHPDGQRGFDTRDVDERSREISRETLAFIAPSGAE